MATPLNIHLLDVHSDIQQHNYGRVTSPFIYESSSKEFAKSGLFSEDIFGQVGSPQRLTTFGYIDLKATIFHPIVYANLVSLKAFYGDIMSRKAYAIFDEVEHDFVRAEEDDEGARTGFKFFLEYFPKIIFQKNASVSHNTKIEQIQKAGDLAYITECLVLPAQLRDVNPDSSRLDPDSINKLYISLLNYTNALPDTKDISSIYDGIVFSIQKKVSEVYQYIFDMISDKFGFFQRKYGSRNLALGTRNVISPAPLDAKSPDDPRQLKVDEIGVPLFEACKAAIPLVIYHAKASFLNHIFSSSSDQVTLIDPKTFELVYQPITEDEKNKFISSDGIEKLVNLFKDREFRFKPLTCKTEDNKYYYLFLVYDEGERVTVARSASAIRNWLTSIHGVFQPNRLRAMTYAEFMYISAYFATRTRHATVTRYPADNVGSTVPCCVHLLSTNPSRTVKLQVGDSGSSIEMPEYPRLGKGFNDSVSLHANIIGGLGADFDGDTVSLSILLSDEANVECHNHINSVGRWFTASGKPSSSFTYMEAMPIYNLTRNPA